MDKTKCWSTHQLLHSLFTQTRDRPIFLVRKLQPGVEKRGHLASNRGSCEESDSEPKPLVILHGAFKKLSLASEKSLMLACIT